jgi:hypothetical protein
MDLNDLKNYAELVGVKFEVRLFDGGQSLSMRSADGKHEVRYSIYWGDEERFYALAHRWLDGQPWSSEDDPRVAQEGVYA